MAIRPFRFLHASDFHLERPLGGLIQPPEHLRDLLLDAAYHAAENVFDTAVVEEVDFILLTGDILDIERSGAYGLSFLVSQFERMAQEGIAVYWVGGKADPPERWPDSIRLPENVHRFVGLNVTEIIHRRDDEPIAAVLGLSQLDSTGGQVAAQIVGQFKPSKNNRFTIAAMHGELTADDVARSTINYWALGGDHRRRTISTTPSTAHQAGTIQGRDEQETGAHGCTLVHVDGEGRIRTQLVAVDCIRWHNEKITLHDESSLADLERILRERTKSLAVEAGERQLLVNWKVAVGGKLATMLRRGGKGEEIAVALRKEFGSEGGRVWTAAIAVEPPKFLPDEWYEEDTILGDYLRAMREMERNNGGHLDIRSYVSDQEISQYQTLGLDVQDENDRRQLLREAALLGAEWLRGEEVFDQPAARGAMARTKK
jgi:DNA repair protein SbcD/Mre11